MFYVGVDLGQKRDHTAIAVVEKVELHRPWGEVVFEGLDVRYVERVALKTPYPAVVERIRRLVRKEPLRGNCILAVDTTGVGAAVIDLMRRSDMGCEISAITITGGGRAALNGNVWSVPKVDLWSALTVMLEREELRISGEMAGVGALVRELEGLQLSSGSARAGERDDLAMALALAVWKATRHGFGVVGGGQRTDGYDAVLKYHCRL